MFWQRKHFAGDYRFHSFQGEISAPIEDFPIPEEVTIPLHQGFGEPVFPLVKVGDHVRAGQLIGASDSVSSPVHASVNGIVKAIQTVEWPAGRQVEVVTIEGDESEEYETISKYSPRYWKKRPEQIRVLLYRSGVSGLGSRGIPTQFNSSTIPLEKVTCVVVPAVYALPFTSGSKVLLHQRIDQFVSGLGILNHALNGVPVFVTLDKKDWEIRDLLDLKKEKLKWLKIIKDSFLFPGMFSRLSKTKLKEKSDGAVVLNPQDVMQVYEAVVEGKPLIDKVVALVGNGFVKSVGFRTRIGTPIKDLINSQLKKELDTRVIIGNSQSGKPYQGEFFPVNKSSGRVTALIEPKKNGAGSEQNTVSNSFLSKLFPIKTKS